MPELIDALAKTVGTGHLEWTSIAVDILKLLPVEASPPQLDTMDAKRYASGRLPCNHLQARVDLVV
eukprot:12921698-Prorocentrum_lima.AAC.1